MFRSFPNTVFESNPIVFTIIASQSVFLNSLQSGCVGPVKKLTTVLLQTKETNTHQPIVSSNQKFSSG